MKPIAFSLALCGLLCVAPVSAQERDEAPVPSVPVEVESPWLAIALKIIPLENSDPYSDNDDLSETEGRAKGQMVADLETLTNQLLALPDAQVAQAYRYMLERATVKRFKSYTAGGALKVEPSAENVRFVRPYFDKLSDESKAEFLREVAINGIMLRLEVPEFREFPRDILQKAANGTPVSQDLVSQSALMLVTHTTSAEKQLMHQALARDFKNAGLWNALTQINELTSDEVREARQMFVSLKNDAGWRLTLALALSPYDAQMSAVVQRAVENELKASGDINVEKILSNPNADEQQRQLEQSASIDGLAALNHWELKKALPYLFRVMRSQNPFVANVAMPILAIRAPQEVMRISRLPGARDDIFHLDFGVGLVALLHPQFQEQAKKFLDGGPPQDDDYQGYEQVTQAFYHYGVLGTF